MPMLTPQQETFAKILSQKTGLDHGVVRSWVASEESGSAAQQRAAEGNMNWLNYSAGTGPGGRFDHPEWNNNPAKAADAIANVINTSSYYTGIKASAGSHPGDQIKAIAESPWDAGHYGGNGSHLFATYQSVRGLPAPAITTPSPTVPKTPKTPENITETPQTTPLPASFLKGASVALPSIGSTASAPILPALPSLKGSSIPLPPVPAPEKAVAAAASTLAKPTSTISSTILATAKSQLGVPYKWGGESKGVAFDCSGLVQWAAAQHGVKLPRTSEQQVHSGVAVKSVTMLKPGDLLFFGAANAPHHVAIFAGDGKMLQSPHTGGHVEIVPLRTADLSAMRRIG